MALNPKRSRHGQHSIEQDIASFPGDDFDNLFDFAGGPAAVAPMITQFDYGGNDLAPLSNNQQEVWNAGLNDDDFALPEGFPNQGGSNFYNQDNYSLPQSHDCGTLKDFTSTSGFVANPEPLTAYSLPSIIHSNEFPSFNSLQFANGPQQIPGPYVAAYYGGSRAETEMRELDIPQQRSQAPTMNQALYFGQKPISKQQIDQTYGQQPKLPLTDRMIQEAYVGDAPFSLRFAEGSGPRSTQETRPPPQHHSHSMSTASSQHSCAARNCGKCFDKRSDLAKHERSHIPVEDRPLWCQTCDWRCNERRDMDRHLNGPLHRKRFRLAQKNAAQRPIKTYHCPFSACQIRGRWFSRRDNCIRHLKADHPASEDMKPIEMLTPPPSSTSSS